MKLLVYTIGGQKIGIDIHTWTNATLSGNTAFITIADTGSTPTNYVDISSVINWDKYGSNAGSTQAQIKNEIIKLIPVTPTQSQFDILANYMNVGINNMTKIGNTIELGSILSGSTLTGIVDIKFNTSGGTITGPVTLSSTITTTGSTCMCSPIICGTSCVSGPKILGSTSICSPVITGSTKVCSPIVCSTSCASAPTVCATTSSISPLHCGACVYATTIVCSPVITGSTKICSPIVFGTTCSCSGIVCATTIVTAACSIGTTCVCSPVILASTSSCSPIHCGACGYFATTICSPVITGSTRVCSPIICATSCVRSATITGTTTCSVKFIENGTCLASTYSTINTSICSLTSNCTIDATFAGKTIEANGTFTITFPNSMCTGMQVDIVNICTGAITVAASTTMQSCGNKCRITAQYAGASVYHRGSNVWLAVGNLVT